MKSITAIIDSMETAYSQHRVQKNLKVARKVALGPFTHADAVKDEYALLKARLDVDSIIKSMDIWITYKTLSHSYLQLITTPRENSPTTKENENKSKLDILNSINVYFFPEEDYTDVSDDSGISCTFFHPCDSIEDTLLRYAKFRATQVYSRSDKYQHFDVISGFDQPLRAKRTLSYLTSVDASLQLSKYPTEKYQQQVHFLNFYDNYPKVNDEELRARPVIISFDESITVKTFRSTDPVCTTNERLDKSPSLLKVRPILKQRHNMNYFYEHQLSHYCDEIDSSSFIRLLDLNLKKRVKRHRQRQSDNVNCTITQVRAKKFLDKA